MTQISDQEEVQKATAITCENYKDSTDPQILRSKRLRVEETEILDLKNIITEQKDIQEGFNSNSNKQKKDSVNLKTAHLKLLNLKRKN